MPELLSSEALAKPISTLPYWVYDPDRAAIHRVVRFSGFPQALAAMVEIGFEAERCDHHPDWSNVHNRLDIWLTTRAAGGVSIRDIELARTIDTLPTGSLISE